MEIIASLQNKWVKYIKSLQQRKYREKEKAFLLEGIRLLEEAVEASWPLKLGAYSPKLLQNPRGNNILQTLKSKEIPLLCLTDEILDKAGDTQNSQGILAVACEKETDWKKVWTSSPEPVLVIVDGVQDPGNLGTIIRTADAHGAQGVLLTKGTVDLYNSKTIRSTMGSIFHLPILRIDNLTECLQLLNEQKFKIVVGDLAAEEYCFQYDYTGAIAICVGNEGAGPSPELKEKAHTTVKIPILGQAESLNVAVATGILLYEINRQRFAG